MKKLLEVQELYDRFIGTVEDLEKKRNITDGLFGFGRKPSDDPCHDRFAEDLKKLLERQDQEGFEPGEAAAVLEYIFFIPERHKEPVSIYWMLLAVQSLSENLIRHLSKAEASSLESRYEEQYPRRDRLPPQKRILKALKAMCR